MNSQQLFLSNTSESPISTNTSVQKNNESTETTQVNLENVDDFANVCRTCATITEFVIPIFDGEGLQNNLADKIHKHLPIQVSSEDRLPVVVCYQCASTLLAWHELVACCAQADAALRTALARRDADSRRQQIEQADKEDAISLGKDQQIKYDSCLVSFDNCRLTRNDINTTEFQDNEDFYTSHDFEIFTETNESTQKVKEDAEGDEDDQPLSNLASKKIKDICDNFYTALINFRNHFVTAHKKQLQKCSYPDFTEESDTDDVEDTEFSGQPDIEDFDDLTHNNMRKDRMNDEMRLELSQVQTKINGKNYYTCRTCGKHLSSSHTYEYHKRIHTGERPCVCHICGKQFRAPNGLQRHLTETHERARRHSCRYCTKNFANSQNLKQHMRIHTGERPFVCSQCGKCFTQSGSLHVHLKTHSEQFPFHCAECGAKFRLRSGLARHRLKHTGERPYICDQCGKGFRQKHELNTHIFTHTDLKPYSCLVCGVAFRQKRALKHHSKRVHESEQTVSEVINPLIITQVGQYSNN